MPVQSYQLALQWQSLALVDGSNGWSLRRLPSFSITQHPNMTFEALYDDKECNCIDNAIEDSESAFLRIIDSNAPKERDFLSKWERYVKQGKEISHSTCDETCGWKGVSMNKVNGYEEEEVVGVLRQALLFQPQGKKRTFSGSGWVIT